MTEQRPLPLALPLALHRELRPCKCTIFSAWSASTSASSGSSGTESCVGDTGRSCVAKGVQHAHTSTRPHTAQRRIPRKTCLRDVPLVYDIFGRHARTLQVSLVRQLLGAVSARVQAQSEAHATAAGGLQCAADERPCCIQGHYDFV